MQHLEAVADSETGEPPGVEIDGVAGTVADREIRGLGSRECRQQKEAQ
jgi:hypothetical protein